MVQSDNVVQSLAHDARFRVLVNAVTDYAIYMLDHEGVVASWNPGAQRFKGYERDEIIGQHFSRFYTEEDRATDLPRRALKMAAEEGRFEAEGWRVRKDGTRFWAHVVIDPIRDDAGKLIGFAKITRDLSDRKASEDALRQSEERFRLLVQSVTDYAIYMLDPEGRVSNWNSGAQRIKGYAPDEIIGQHFSRFYTDEDRDRGLPQRGLETAAREGRFEAEGQRVRKDGTRFWAHVVIDPIRDDAGKLIGFAKITRDITERVEAQRALEEAREAFFQSQKMEAIGQLTGGVAHDFNNLLMAVLGSLELVRKRVPDDPSITRFIDNATKAAERGAALTQRMLAFSRRQDLAMAPVDVPTLVRGMADLMQRSIGPSISIETRFSLSLDNVRTDPHQLELALLNLVVNARDAMPQGGSIVIAARQEKIEQAHSTGLPPGQYVCLSLTDNGEGMNEETLSRAMEPFFTTKGVGKGTGLGLSMVHGLAEQCGGRLVLKSHQGEGTTAELWLAAAKPLPMTVEQTQRSSAELDQQGQCLSILAVDDDGLVLMNTAAMLEELGHTAYEATSGKQALEILREKPVDLVITDFAMPQMNGSQLVHAIRAEWPDMKVVLATGYAELPADAEADLPKLSKPFRQADLAEVIAAVASGLSSGQILRFPSQPAASGG